MPSTFARVTEFMYVDVNICPKTY